jgi:hypothetical protein
VSGAPNSRVPRATQQRATRCATKLEELVEGSDAGRAHGQDQVPSIVHTIAMDTGRWARWVNDWGTVTFIVVLALALWVAITAPDAPGRIWGSTALWDVVGKVAILATIAGGVAAVVGVIVAIWVGLPQLRETRVELARIANQLTAAPNLVIGLPDKPDQADEGGLEWFHLEVSNMASTEGIPLTAREAHVSVVVDDRTERHLMWSGGAFGLTVPVADIRARAGRYACRWRSDRAEVLAEKFLALRLKPTRAI